MERPRNNNSILFEMAQREERTRYRAGVAFMTIALGAPTIGTVLATINNLLSVKAGVPIAILGAGATAAGLYMNKRFHRDEIGRIESRHQPTSS